MSLILEALRKSEAERRRGEAPDLLRAEPARAATANTTWRPWLLAVPALLGVVLLAWWLRGTQSPDAANSRAQAQAHAAPVAATADAVAPAPAPMPAIERLQPPPPATTPAPVRESTAKPGIATPGPAAPSTTPAMPVALGALPPAQRKALPPLRLSMHLWNEDPARRVAILDGRRVTPGDHVGDAVVAEIRRDGVLLDWAGEQVLVPLP